jgi:hypothetical protein
MSDMNAARKAMLRLLALFPVPAGTGRPCEVRCYLLDVDSFLETLPALETEAAKRERAEALTRAEYDTREAALMLQLAELREEVARYAGVEDAIAVATKSVCLHTQVESRAERKPAPSIWGASGLPEGYQFRHPLGITFDAYIAHGWTLETLVKHGVVDAVTHVTPGFPPLSAVVAKEMETNGNAMPRNDGWGGVL